jgi:hypothetical protein
MLYMLQAARQHMQKQAKKLVANHSPFDSARFG